MTNKVKNGWHESKFLGCEFMVYKGIIITATDLNHTKILHAYDVDGNKVNCVPYFRRYIYKWR